MTKRVKIDDKVSFTFAGSKLEGIVIELYKHETQQKTTHKAIVKGTNDVKGYKYPVEVEKLTKL